MKLQSATRLCLVLGATSACGDNKRPCQPTDIFGHFEGYDHVCTSAIVYAARDTAELIPGQMEIDRYYERLGRAAESEPLVNLMFPQMRRASSYGHTGLTTTNPKVIAAWMGITGPAPPTGDAEFDELISELIAPYVHFAEFDTSGDQLVVSLGTGGIFNEEQLHSRLLPLSSLPEAVEPRHGGTWRWIGATGSGTDEATAEVDLRAGWGDCFSGCTWFHNFRAVIPPEGPATVYDLGGDPLPAGMEPSPNTRPPPGM